jgi:hypothetical protein
MEVFVHELGHNMGMTHAGVDWDEKGNFITYGDPTAFMGNSWFTSNDQLIFNAPHRAAVGWVPSSQIVQPSTSGFYSLSPIDILLHSTIE